MRARLFCRAGELRGTDLEIGREATIGRGADCSLTLDSRDVSERHARIVWDDETRSYVLEDLGSTNGTEIDGFPVRTPHRLGHLHVVTFAHLHSFIFHEIDPTPLDLRDEVPPAPPGVEMDPTPTPAELGPVTGQTVMGRAIPVPSFDEESTMMHPQVVPLPTGLDASPPAEAAPPPPPTFWLEVEVDGSWQRFELGEGETVVGRQDCDIELSVPGISRQHAAIELAAGKLTIRDLGSTNHTFLAGAPITTAPIGDGAELGFGSTKARIVVRSKGLGPSGGTT